MPTSGPDEILTLQEVATYLKLAERTVYGYAQKGLVPGIKVGSSWRFRKADIDRWLDEQRRLTEQSTSKRAQTRKPLAVAEAQAPVTFPSPRAGEAEAGESRGERDRG
jgi:excisionase family DNA binding protein